MLKYSLVLFLFMINLYSSSIKGDSEFEQKNYYKAIKYYKLVTIKEDKYIHIKLAQSYIDQPIISLKLKIMIKL